MKKKISVFSLVLVMLVATCYPAYAYIPSIDIDGIGGSVVYYTGFNPTASYPQGPCQKYMIRLESVSLIGNDYFYNLSLKTMDWQNLNWYTIDTKSIEAGETLYWPDGDYYTVWPAMLAASKWVASDPNEVTIYSEVWWKSLWAQEVCKIYLAIVSFGSSGASTSYPAP